MADWQKLMEAVAPLFEYSDDPAPDPKVVAKFADVDPKHRSYYITKWAEKKGIDSDDAMFMAGYVQDGYIGAGAYNWRYVGMGESVAEETVTENNVEAIEELEHILDELERLGEQARYAVRSISREAERQLDAYGAFDFGSSSNQYDVTLAGFLDDAQSGSYDERD